MARPSGESAKYAFTLGISVRQLHNLGGMERLKNMSEEARALLVSDAHRARYPDEFRKQLEENCPDGYKVVDPRKPFNMLGKKEVWIIYEKHAEPFVMKIPEDFWGPNAKRAPRTWGRPLYQKIV